MLPLHPLLFLLHPLLSFALPSDAITQCGQVHVEVIGKEDGPQGGNRHGEGNTGAAGVRDRQSQARTCASEVSLILWKAVSWIMPDAPI